MKRKMLKKSLMALITAALTLNSVSYTAMAAETVPYESNAAELSETNENDSAEMSEKKDPDDNDTSEEKDPDAEEEDWDSVEMISDNTISRKLFSRSVTRATSYFGDVDYVVYNNPLKVEITEGTEATYQWYKASTYTGDGAAISGATEQSYTPTGKELGGWLYCTVTVSENEPETTERVRVVASEKLVETEIKVNNSTFTSNWAAVSNTSHNSGGSGSLDVTKLVKGGYFYLEYESETAISSIPQFQLQTWSSASGKTSQLIQASESGSVNGKSNTYYAKYSYEDCINKWGDEDFQDLKALRVYCTDTNADKITIAKVSWFGAPLSIGESGEKVPFQSGNLIFTWHVGGTFDATRIREDSYFLVEYTGEADAVEFVAASSSYVVNGSNQYKTLSEPAETGETGSGYYSKFTAQQIKESFGSQFRYIDQFRVNTKSGKTANSKALYFFEGTSDLVDDISKDGYDDAITIPWPKYADEPQDGIVVIGASITQNPLVTPAALSGAPYYNAQGGWNAVLDRTDCITYGIGSQITTNVANRFDEILKYDYKKIIIQCGNNDLGMFGGVGEDNDQKVVELETKNYKSMFDKVAAKNQELVNVGKEPIQVYTISLNPTNAEGIQNRIVKVNEAIGELGNQYDFVTRIDIHEDFKNETTGSPTNTNCGEYHVNMDLVMADGLHPVAAGYKIWAQKLKKAMASTDKADASLITLSYRTSDTEKKQAVPGFKSTEAAKALYTVGLPEDTADDASVKLFVTPHNLDATVTADGASLSKDSYEDDYVEVTLENGEADVAIEVKSADSSKTKTYNVHFVNDGSSVEKEPAQTYEITDANISSWGGVSFTRTDTITNGTTVEFDLEVANENFTKLLVLPNANWKSNLGSTVELAVSDFEDKKAHVTCTYSGEELVLTGIQIKFTPDTDYRGVVTVDNLKITKPTAPKPVGLEITDENIENWPYISFDQAGTITDGTKIEYDLEVENTDFEQLLILTNVNWNDCGTMTLKPSDFIDGKAHITNTYSGKDLALTGIQIKSGPPTDYRGVVTITSIKVTAPTIVDPGELVENIIYEGNMAAEGGLASIMLQSTNFNMEKVVPGGYFYVEYQAAEELQMALALSEWDTSTWAEVTATETGTTEDGLFYAKYSFTACSSKYGKDDMSDVDALSTKAADAEYTLKSVKWFGPKVDIPYEMLYKGTSRTLKGPSDGAATYFYTKHVGGDFDNSALDEESYFTLEYTSTVDAVTDQNSKLTVALSSASDTDNETDNHWVAVSPSTTVKLENGNYLSTYTIADCVEAFGSNLQRLDQVQVYTAYNTAADAEFVLKEMKYFKGNGTLIDPAGETKWTNKRTTGIGFIGDSICQNAMLLYENWNTILGRDDCVDTNWGIGGQNTTQISRRIDDMLASADYEKIVVLCGINDLGHGITKDQYITNYTTIINKIHAAQPETRVYAISILPTTGEFYPDQQPDIADRNTALKSLADQHDFVTYVDCYSKFYDESTGKCKDEYVFDGLHPNDVGYGVIAELLNPILDGENPDNPDIPDKTGLNALIAEYKNMVQGSYTDETWKNFIEALAKAEEVAANEKATAEEVAAAVENLENAKKALKENEKPKEGFWAESIEDVIYTGKAIKPTVRVYDGMTLLSANKDYKVRYSNNTKVGTAHIVIIGKGNYAGSITKDFKIVAKNLNDQDIVIDDLYVNAPKNSKAVKPAPVVTRGKTKLKANRDYIVECEDKTEGAYITPGTYEVTIKAVEGNGYEGSRKIYITLADTVKKEILMSKVSITKIPNQTYDGKDKEPLLSVKYKGKDLILHEDYEAEYTNNTEIGTAIVKITGKGKYVGIKKASFRIVGTALKANMVTGIPKSVEYTGEEIRPQVTVNGLEYETDYLVDYTHNTEIGTATVIITGIKKYSGSVKKTFKITPFDLKSNKDSRFVLVSKDITAPYAKGGSKPSIEVTFNGKPMVEGVDYKLAYKNNKQIEKAGTITIKGIKRFKGSVSNDFTISQQSLENLKATAADILVKKANKYANVTPVIVDLDGKKLVKNKDYTIVGVFADKQDTVVTGTPKVGDTLYIKATGKGNYTGTEYAVFRVIANDKSIAKAAIKVTDQPYTGKAIEPTGEAVKVTIRGRTDPLIEGVDYEIVKDGYSKNINKGKATITIRGINEYGGTKVGTFKITAQSISWADWYESTVSMLRELLYY